MVEGKSAVGIVEPTFDRPGADEALLCWAREHLDPGLALTLSRSAEGLETLRRMRRAASPLSFAYQCMIALPAMLMRLAENVLAWFERKVR